MVQAGDCRGNRDGAWPVCAMTSTEIVWALHRKRMELGLSRKEISERSGVSADEIARTEYQGARPGLNKLLDWAGALGLEIIVKEL